MKWVIVFFMAINNQPPGEFVVNGPGYASQSKCEQAIVRLNLPQTPRPFCVQEGEQ